MANDNDPEIDKGGGANICLKALCLEMTEGKCASSTLCRVCLHTRHIPQIIIRTHFNFMFSCILMIIPNGILCLYIKF